MKHYIFKLQHVSGLSDRRFGRNLVKVEPFTAALPSWLVRRALAALDLPAQETPSDLELARDAHDGDPWAHAERVFARRGVRVRRAEGTETLDMGGALPWLMWCSGRWVLRLGDEVHLDAEGPVGPENTPGDAELAYLEPFAPMSATLGHEGHEHGHGHGHGHGHHGVSSWARVRGLLFMERREIAVVFGYAAFASVLALAVPLAVQHLVNTLLFTALVVPILWLSSLVLGGLVLAAVFQLAHLWTVEQVQRRVVVNVLAELAWRLPRVRLEALLSEHGPRLGNRFLDVVVVQKAVATLLVDGVNGLVAAVAGTVLLALYHPYLLGFALTLWTVVVCFLWATGPRAVRTAIAESYAKHEAASLVEELVAHPLAARGQGGAAWAVARADQLAHRYLEARGAHFRAWFLQAGFLLAAYSVASAALLSVGGALVVAGQLSIGQLIAAELVLGAVLGSLSKLGKQLEKVYDLLAGMDKLGHLLDLPVVPSGAERLPPDAAGAELRIDGLQWIHEDGDVLLNGLSCTIPAGATVAVSGPAGAGKRTLLELLAGLRHPSSGHVYADGVDVMALDEDTRTGAVVLAEGTDVVEGSVLENVHMGRVGVSDEDARAALATVGLLEAVERLPDGVRTRVGTRGWPLSRSQARRLTLARALAGKPRVLLVDGDVEPTLFARLVAPGRTLLAVANDPRAWSSCSHRLHLEGGTANLEVLR